MRTRCTDCLRLAMETRRRFLWTTFQVPLIAAFTVALSLLVLRSLTFGRTFHVDIEVVALWEVDSYLERVKVLGWKGFEIWHVFREGRSTSTRNSYNKIFWHVFLIIGGKNINLYLFLISYFYKIPNEPILLEERKYLVCIF